MPFRIQRVPVGLLNLLSIAGGATPTELEDRVRSTLDLLQFYGVQQRQTFSANDPAAAEGTGVNLVLPNAWGVLFAASVTIIKTATMTALRGAVAIRYNGDVNQEEGLASEELGPFGATETGAVSVIPLLPYPRLLPPNTRILGRASIIGTDATCNLTVGANFGVLQ